MRHFAKTHKPIAAVCHGPQILMAAGVLLGRQCTAYPSVRPELTASGAEWVSPSDSMDNVHVDKNLVTAPAWPAQANWMRAFLDLL